MQPFHTWRICNRETSFDPQGRICGEHRLADNRFYFLLHEVWENEGALEAHTTSRHSTQFRATVMRYLEQPIITYQLQEFI